MINRHWRWLWVNAVLADDLNVQVWFSVYLQNFNEQVQALVLDKMAACRW